MSDNHQRYFAIQQALKSLRPTEPKCNLAHAQRDIGPASQLLHLSQAQVGMLARIEGADLLQDC